MHCMTYVTKVTRTAYICDSLTSPSNRTGSHPLLENEMMTMAEDPIENCYVYEKDIVDYLEREFIRLKDDCYLDHAGSTLYSKTQIEHVANDLLSSLHGNPHSLGGASKQTLDLIEQTRFKVLDHFKTNSDEYSVVFTSSATDSLKLVAESFKFFDDEYPPGHFVHLQDNHTSVLGMREVVSRRGARVSCLSHDAAFRLFKENYEDSGHRSGNRNSLFVYPSQCNFSGLKYPLDWIEKTRNNNTLDRFVNDGGSKWFVLLDAASHVATNILDLSIHRPDFVCLSFYKMFGYPTGLGALLVKNSSQELLRKIYYGGGTVEISLSSEMFHSKRAALHERFEDGTLPFLSIISLNHGFETVDKIGWDKISLHVFNLAKYLHDSLLKMHHQNGKPVAILYHDTDYESWEIQGGIVAFNLLRSSGEHVGFVEFLNVANLHKIHLRTGCFCNPGACQRHLKLSNEDLKENYRAGHVCGDERDLVNGKPTGAIRVSFGYMSTISDVEKLLAVIKKCFINGEEVRRIPDWWNDHKMMIKIKYYDDNARLNIEERSNDDVENKSAQFFLGTNDEEKTSVVLKKENNKVGNNEKKERRVILRKLFIYPVKSCASYEINDSWKIGDKGLIYDREWMITTSSGVCLTQKQEMKMCLIKPTINRGENLLRLSYPGMPSVEVPLDISSKDSTVTAASICRSKICGHKVEGIDCGSDVSEWLSLSLGRPGLRLVRENGEMKKSKSPGISFSSQAQYLLINQSSIRWLADKIPDDSECDKETILNRFRGNLVVEGCEEFEEMKWTSLRIGESRFQIEGQCTRCQMICIDQNTGEKTIEPLRTLAEEFHGKIRFGIYLSRTTIEDAYIKIGDEVFYK